jgi:hypothetical protein
MQFDSTYIYRLIRLVQAQEKKKGTIFSVANIKKNGDARKYACRLGVKYKRRSNGDIPTRSLDPSAYNLLIVWDSNADHKKKRRGGFRAVQCSTLHYLRVAKIDLIVEGVPQPEYYKHADTINAMKKLSNVK